MSIGRPTIDDYYRRLEMEEQERLDNAMRQEQRLDDWADRIREDDDLLSEAIAEADTTSPTFRFEYNAALGAFYRSDTASSNDAILEAAKGLAEHINLAVRWYARDKVAQEDRDNASP